MKKNGIIGNPDVAPLYDPAVHPDVAARVAGLAAHGAQATDRGTFYVAERTRPGILTVHGVKGPKRIERITVGAPTLNDAIIPIKEIARQYFQSSPIPWRVENRKFTT
jgi:hypothetical protein